MSNQQVTHCGFSDESSWNDGRYRSIAMVTGTVYALKAMEDELKEVINESKEIKWKGLKDAEKIRAAVRMIRIAGDYAAAGKCRVDTLIWDAQDTRHDVVGRDDLQNLGRMYYHLSRDVLHKKWPSDGAVWMLLPDEHYAVDWDTFERCLDAASKRFNLQIKSSFLDVPGLYRKDLNIEKVIPVKSNKYRLTQMADLFAGISVFSWNNCKDFRSWEKEQKSQQPMFADMRCGASNSSRGRFPVLQELIKVCYQNKFGLSNEPGGLQTPAYNAKNPINFWFYRPQSGHDKAPIKDKVRDKFGR